MHNYSWKESQFEDSVMPWDRVGGGIISAFFYQERNEHSVLSVKPQSRLHVNIKRQTLGSNYKSTGMQLVMLTESFLLFRVACCSALVS